MRILKACALVSVCVIAAASVVLVAMGYTVRLEAPESHAGVIGAGVVAVTPLNGGNVANVLLEDGSMYRFVAETNAVEIEVTRFDEAGGGDWPTPPIPATEILWWNFDWVIGSDGVVYRFNWTSRSWLSAPIPGVPVGASTGAISGLKGQYGGDQGQ